MNTFYNGIHSIEWIETNGLGGYAASTVSGVNTRRYHGILVAAAHPPAGRLVLLARMDEEIHCDDNVFELGSNQYPGTIHPKGFNYIEKFSRKLFPEWIYQLPNGIRLKKTIATVHGENTTLIIYEVLKAEKSFTMYWHPLIAGRDFHAIKRSNDELNRGYEFTSGIFKTKPYMDTPELYISIPGSGIRHDQNWYNNIEYAIEEYRGLEFTEDLFTHGKIYKEVNEGDKFGIIISTINPEGFDALKTFNWERKRREMLISGYDNESICRLVLAADQFIVKRRLHGHSGKTVNGNGATIIAGYHWFGDWGRDTMISLPGLCLSTERFEDAKKILRAFAENISRGMLPNRFPDYEGEEVEYNTVDATLWYFIAIHKYLAATGDKDFVLNELLPVLKEIIDWHFKGTRYNIKANESDGLLSAGEAGQQLTWMDARIGNWVVTPRIGKAVEINALWYNTLIIFADLLQMNGQNRDAEMVKASAEKVKNNFLSVFWNDDKACLYDYVNGEVKDDAVRPNQIFALSLPFPLIDDKEKAESILKIITEKLYTPVGLRSLSPDHPDYKNHYGGDQYHRDSAYHEGTVWSWLIGPYVDALIKVKNERSKARMVIEHFLYHLDEGCIGQISEIFDADAPHHPRGCVAQAWGVAETIRVIKEHSLFAGEETMLSRANKLAEINQ